MAINVLDLRSTLPPRTLGQLDRLSVSPELFKQLNNWLMRDDDTLAQGITVTAPGGLFTIYETPLLPVFTKEGAQIDAIITFSQVNVDVWGPKTMFSPVELMKAMCYGDPDKLFIKPCQS